ncbi:leucine-rich repeat serine/threonine-protein kinase 1-like isoform X2 [Acanthaster planci]|uniref:non-specific serine/threonine protein kinase n=1 Tax=Acanthaster planci TaxID=133434 RepID=A0A8B8A230_ACAPL|nr:leucine-rich repeat serine/threonine-protein kinase 1-like isoform X2 [Acanthaster planci]
MDTERITLEMVEVLSESLLDNIRTKSTSDVARFLKTFPEEVRNHLFPFTEGNKNLVSGQEPSALWQRFPHPFLHVACEYGTVDVVGVLLFFGVDASLRTEKEGTALEVASRLGKLDIIKKLIEWEPKLIQEEDTVKILLATACSAGHQDVAKFWLDKLSELKNGQALCKEDFKAENDPFIAACRGEHYQLAANLLEKKVTVVSRDTAVRTGQKFNHILQKWCQEETDETQSQKKCNARWSDRQLHHFDGAWLTTNQDLWHTLVKINLSHNALKTIPAVLLWGLPCLESLDISHNELGKLPGAETLDMLTETRLTHLKVSHNKLVHPVLEMFMLPLLENLDLSHNDITSLNYKRFPSKLVAPDGGEVVWDWSNMMSLNLSHNQIVHIPRDISTAKSLKKLNVSSNKLAKFPAPWDCPLTNLNASQNNIMDVPDMHGYWSRSLTNLDLSSNRLTEIPWTVCQLTVLKILNLANNQITKLPSPESWSVYSLKELSLADNRLIYVEKPAPSSPFSAKRKSSSLSQKIIFKRDSSVAMETPPPSTFYSSGNEDATSVVFPEIFRDCLMTLSLKNNQLQHVPPSLCSLACLQKLDLSGNTGIEKLPDTLAQLKDLYSLNLDGLKIKEPETVVAAMQEKEHCTRNILEKLNERLLKCSPYRSVKLMLVGPEKCGKTSVLSCLTKREPDDDLGINICSWTLQNPIQVDTRPSFKKKLLQLKSEQSVSGHGDVHFSTWDLKGGELNSMIHQSFLTPRALYLLVWDLRDGSKGVEKLRPWLLNIQSRASESAIIIVSTHRDKVKKSQSPEAIRQEIRTKYSHQDGFPDIAEIVEVTALSPDGEGIKELRHVIYQKALGMRIKKTFSSGATATIPLIGRMVPRTFTILQEIIANEADRRRRSIPPLPPVMKDAELTSHIRKIPDSRIVTTQDIEDAAEFLSTCGSLVHFSDHLQGLTSLYFLDPVWLYNILISVANINPSFVREGRVHRSSLEELFQESGFGEGRFEEYLQLLQRFEIVLPISRIEYLIPSRLPKEKPGQDLSPLQGQDDSFQVLERLYKIPYTPPGFWSRLVSRVYVGLKILDQERNKEANGVSRQGMKRGVKLQRSRMQRSMRVGLKLAQTNIMYWQEGVSVQHHSGRVMLKPITFQDTKPGIYVMISCQDGEFKAMGFMVDQIEHLMKEWYPGLLGVDEFSGKPLVERLIPCPVCRSKTLETHYSYNQTPATDSQGDCHHFSVSNLALTATMKGTEEVECPRHSEEVLALPKLIPDLFLMDLPIRILDKKMFDFDPKVSRSLGSGGFGEVFKAQFRHKDVAVKMLITSTFFTHRTDSGMHSSTGDEDSKKSSNGSDLSDSSKKSLSPRLYDEKNIDVNAIFVMEGFSNLRSEVATMSKLQHPCIIRLIGISIQHLCFAMELAPLGDLASHLKREIENQRESFAVNGKVYRTILDRVLTFKIALQIAHGVSYLHSKRIIYSDLKTDNVLLYSIALDAPVNIKLTDYGIARPMDLEGARGQAGPMGFCAPEILRGRTFTEKVDWFSYSMLLYHLMSGAWPYDNLKSAIEVRNAINTGIKPSFHFRDYTIITLFPNLERLMLKCWTDNPLQRPSGHEIAMAMENASFTCLKNVIQFDVDEITCVHPGSGEMFEQSDRLWLWTGENENRQCTKIHIKFFKHGELYPKSFKGSRVNCMVQVGHFELIGTEDRVIQLYGPPAVGPQQNVHQQDFHVDSAVLCLCYQPIKDKDIQGHLFAGLADGHVVIFSHAIAATDSSGTQHSPAWFKSKTITFENKCCNQLELVPEREELWIACGNKLRILDTKIMLLDKMAIPVTQRVEGTIMGLAHYHDNLFCTIDRSSRVLQYSMAKRQLVQILQCGNIMLAKGDCLISTSPDDTQVEDGEFKEEQDVVTEVQDVSDAEAETGTKSTPLSDDRDDISFRDSYFSSSPSQSSATLPSPPKRGQTLSWRTQPKPMDNTDIQRPFSEGALRLQSSMPISLIRSILTVKDTLWIGTASGKTLIVSLGSESQHKYSFGEVLAILELFPEFEDKVGPVRQLLRARDEYVVAWMELKASSAPSLPVTDNKTDLHHYQMLVWQAWGSEEVEKFEHIHHMLNKAEVAPEIE